MQHSPMTADEFRALRARLGLTREQMAGALRMSVNGHRTIERWETGAEPVSGPASVAIEALASGFRPIRLSAKCALPRAA